MEIEKNYKGLTQFVMVDAHLDGQSSNSNLVPYSRNRNKLQSKVDVPCQEPCFARKTSEDSPCCLTYLSLTFQALCSYMVKKGLQNLHITN